MRSGLRTYGAQHLCSLVKTSENVKRIIGGWDVLTIAQRDTERWLNSAFEEEVNIVQIVSEIQTRNANTLKQGESNCGDKNYHYSLPQLCELSEQKRVMALMSSKERMHIEAHSGQHHLWIRQLPLSFKKYALTTPEWMVAVRKRLMIDVFAYQSHCTFCKGGWCDVKGGHSIMCAGGHSRTL